jgi:glycosyltransferase involved in cell wall biosynthesis
MVSIIIPTLGRPSLKRTLESLVPQLSPEDEVLVVGDGPQSLAATISASFGSKVRYLEHGPTFIWGHAQRNYGMKQAVSSHLAFMDDDDIYLPGALNAIHGAIRRHPNSPILFRMLHLEDVIWIDREVKVGNMGPQTFVVPNVSSKLGAWRPSTEYLDGACGDFLFIQETIRLFGEESLIWKEDIVAELSEHSRGRRSG